MSNKLFSQVGTKTLRDMNRDNARNFAGKDDRPSEIGAANFLLNTKKELSILKTPTNKFIFVGTVPVELAYQRGNNNIWNTYEEAVEAARQKGYKVK